MPNLMENIVSGVCSFYDFDDSNPIRQRKFMIEDTENGVSVLDWIMVAEPHTNIGTGDNPDRNNISVYSKKPLYYKEWYDGSPEPGTWNIAPSEMTADGERWLLGSYPYYYNVGLIPDPDYIEIITDGIGSQPGLGNCGIPIYDTEVTPPKPAGYAWLNNPDPNDLSNYDELLKYQRCLQWTLYMDSDMYYLTWYSPYIEETHGDHGVYPYDATIDIKLTYQTVGTDPTSEATIEYTAEPFVFSYRHLLQMVIPSKMGQMLAKIGDNITMFLDSGDLKMEFRASWKETDTSSGSTSEKHTDWMNVIFDPKNFLQQQFTHTSAAIKSYTATAPDGSTLTIKDGIPDNDPDYKKSNWNGVEYKSDSDYIDPSDSSDVWTDETEYSTLNSLTKTYAMTPARLDALGSFLWGNNFYSLIHSVNSCPIENIVGLYAFPFDLTGTDEEIYLGNAATGVNGAKVSNSYNPKISVGSIDISGLYDSFLDYGPYTKLYMFLPFLGLKELDIARCIGKTLTLEYVPDLVTGVSAANIFIDGKMEYTFSCQLGIQIPLNATNAGQVTAGVISNLATTAVVASASIATENYIGAVGAIAGGGVAAATAKVSTETSGASSPNCWSKMPRTAFLLYDRPTYQELAMFNHTYGRMCNLSKQLGSLKGFTQISNIDLSGIQIATKQEADEIRELLKEGVWL